MNLRELIQLFMETRKSGLGGVRKCSPATLRIYKDNLRYFEEFMTTQGEGGVTRFEAIRRLHLSAFFDHLTSRVEAGEWAEPTKLQILRTLKTFFIWVDQDDECQELGLKSLRKYLPKIKKNPRRVDIPEIDVLKKFKAVFNTNDKWEYRDYIVTSLLADTGLRISEVCNLTVDMMMLNDKILVVKGKTGTRPVAISNDMVRMLRSWMRRRDFCPKSRNSEYVFISKRAEKMTQNGFGQSFRKHCIKHGLPRVTAHTFRHAFCTNYLRNGGDIYKLQMMTGHTTLEQLKDYVHAARLGSKAMQDELEKVSLLKSL